MGESLDDLIAFNRYLKEKARKYKAGNREEFRDLLPKIRSIAPSIKIEELTPYQFRFYIGEVRLDIYPSNKKFHNINTQKRGRYQNIFEILEREGQRTEGPPKSKTIPKSNDWQGDQSIGEDDPPW